jgi:hypothetical protein
MTDRWSNQRAQKPHDRPGHPTTTPTLTWRRCSSPCRQQEEEARAAEQHHLDHLSEPRLLSQVAERRVWGGGGFGNNRSNK